MGNSPVYNESKIQKESLTLLRMNYFVGYKTFSKTNKFGGISACSVFHTFYGL